MPQTTKLIDHFRQAGLTIDYANLHAIENGHEFGKKPEKAKKVFLNRFTHWTKGRCYWWKG